MYLLWVNRRALNQVTLGAPWRLMMLQVQRLCGGVILKRLSKCHRFWKVNSG